VFVGRVRYLSIAFIRETSDHFRWTAVVIDVYEICMVVLVSVLAANSGPTLCPNNIVGKHPPKSTAESFQMRSMLRLRHLRERIIHKSGDRFWGVPKG